VILADADLQPSSSLKLLQTDKSPVEVARKLLIHYSISASDVMEKRIIISTNLSPYVVTKT